MYSDDQYNNPYHGPQGGYGSPPPKKSSTLLWVLGIGGMGGFFLLACCGLCGGLGYVGLEAEEAEIRTMFEDNEIVAQHIGHITSVERDWSRSLASDDDEIWYFRVEGVNGTGYIIIKDRGFDEFDLEWARLETDTGEEFEIYP